MTISSWNALWAGAFLDELARCGVREICVAPGSRSTPLVLAAAGNDRFRMFSIVDERSAGFCALGIGKRSGRPAAVITTSGTAAANLYPAVIEASQGEVPLLVLTADRPHRLRDTDGNQAMDQIRLFGSFPRGFFEVELPRGEGPSLRHLRGLASRAVSMSLGPPRGPVHLNFPFEKPLEPGLPASGPPGDHSAAEADTSSLVDDPGARRGRSGGEPFVRISPRRLSAPAEELGLLRRGLEASRRGVIVAGPVPDSREVGSAVLALGIATGFPVLADPLSGARFSSNPGSPSVGGYDLFLRSTQARKALAPDLILRVGGSPTSAAAMSYLAESGETVQFVVDDGHRWKDHLASAHHYIQASPSHVLRDLVGGLDGNPDPQWRSLWLEAETRTRRVWEDRGAGALLEGELLAAVASALPEGSNLLVASSMPIRDLDAFAFPSSNDLRVFGNRGVSGIDGLVSTTMGIALGSVTESGREASPSVRVGPESPTVGVLGDLAFFHDMNGLLALKALRPRVVLVVVNNDGGGIFHTLPVREYEPAFSKFFTTPHGLEFGKAAELYGIPYAKSSTLPDFREQLSVALEADGPMILEVLTNREETHSRRRQVVSDVVRAMDGLGTLNDGVG